MTKTSPEQVAAIRAALAGLGRKPTHEEERAIAQEALGDADKWRSVWALARSFEPGKRPSGSTRNPAPAPPPPPKPKGSPAIRESVPAPRKAAPKPEPEGAQPEPPTEPRTYSCSACMCIFRTDRGEATPNKCPGCGEVFA